MYTYMLPRGDYKKLPFQLHEINCEHIFSREVSVLGSKKLNLGKHIRRVRVFCTRRMNSA
jgi:hypothetical protein